MACSLKSESTVASVSGAVLWAHALSVGDQKTTSPGVTPRPEASWM